MSIFALENPAAVFIGIPKTASSTVREGLWQKRYRAHYSVGMPAWAADLIAAGQISFTIVRHPLDRLASAYRDFTQIRNLVASPEDFAGVVLDRHISYELFDISNKIRHHTLPLTHPAYALDYAQHIFRFECLDRHLPFMCDLIGLKPPAEMPHVKQTQGTGYTEFMGQLSKQRRDAIIRYYEHDAERFGYDLSV